MKFRIGMLIGASLALAGAAQANDSSAVLGMGGLQLVQNDDVAMVAEDLYISMDEIRIRYEFQNRTAADIETLVAFPLPPLELGSMWEIPIDRPVSASGVLLDFKVTVDGRPLQPELSVRSFFEGEEVTETLAGYGTGLERSFLEENYYEATAALTAADRKQFARTGLAGVDEYGFYPQWTQEAAFHWWQTFPAGRTIVVEHSYKPIVGQTFFGRTDLAEVRNGAPYLNTDYCIDAATANGVQRQLDAAARTMGEYPYVLSNRIDYVLSTGANWAGPIERFHLTVDKGAADNIVSLCASDITKTGPTVFELTRRDFEPTEDLHILILEPPPPF